MCTQCPVGIGSAPARHTPVLHLKRQGARRYLKPLGERGKEGIRETLCFAVSPHSTICLSRTPRPIICRLGFPKSGLQPTISVGVGIVRACIN